MTSRRDTASAPVDLHYKQQVWRHDVTVTLDRFARRKLSSISTEIVFCFVVSNSFLCGVSDQRTTVT